MTLKSDFFKQVTIPGAGDSVADSSELLKNEGEKSPNWIKFSREAPLTPPSPDSFRDGQEVEGSEQEVTVPAPKW